MSLLREKLEKAYLSHSVSLDELNKLVGDIVADESGIEGNKSDLRLLTVSIGPYVKTGSQGFFIESHIGANNHHMADDEFMERYVIPMVKSLLVAMKGS